MPQGNRTFLIISPDCYRILLTLRAMPATLHHKPLDRVRPAAIHSPSMAKWLQSAGKMLLVMTLVVSMGGHFAFLQAIAWGNMLVNYSSQSSFSEAVGKTFDGEHPCELCKVVKKTKSEEEKKPLLKAEMKMDIALPSPIHLSFPKGTDVVPVITRHTATFSTVYLGVPLQPPRAA